MVLRVEGGKNVGSLKFVIYYKNICYIQTNIPYEINYEVFYLSSYKNSTCQVIRLLPIHRKFTNMLQ